MADLAEAAMNSKAWPFQEARQLLKRVEKSGGGNDRVVFQTGFGPSGLPHIGTFGEVSRTSMVRYAFETISGRPTKLICFSDDMDGLRKVPENVPDRDVMREDLDLPLCRVRDPFGTHESFAAHNNAKLRSFLDRFGFDYDFLSSAECYRQGLFDDMLLRILERFDDVMAVMLPTLGGVVSERAESYSPFLPVSPKSGRVLQVPTLERNPSKGTIVYEEPDGERIEVSVLGGHVKLQWKPDWAMRWMALNVDYEMYGKDLIPSAEVGGQICRVLGGRPPAGMAYELFLDEDGQKISKSKGTGGVIVDEWLDCAAAESLSFFMFQKPKTAKRLFAEVIPKAVDDYHRHLRAFPGQDEAARLSNPVWHVHRGNPPESTMSVSYSMLLNLASAASAEHDGTLWGFIRKYEPVASPEANPDLAAAAEGAVRYFQRWVFPKREFRVPDSRQQAALFELQCRLWFWAGGADAETIQSVIYAVGRKHRFEPMKDWFRTIYEVLFGSSQGPRMGGFTAVYGIQETAELIARRLTAAAPEEPVDESGLALPALLYLGAQTDGCASAGELGKELKKALAPELGDESASAPQAGSETGVLVDSFISHRDARFGICGQGLAECSDESLELRITDAGRRYIGLG